MTARGWPGRRRPACWWHVGRRGRRQPRAGAAGNPRDLRMGVLGWTRVRPIDVKHLGREKVICAWEVDGLIVDPGPQSCEEALLAALDDEPRGLLLTHIHFDHAGAAGALVRRWPH